MKLAQPFLPVEAKTEGLQYRVSVVGREIVFGADSLPVSIKAGGQEILAAPVRFVGIEDGEPIQWDTNYPDNESESFIQSRSDEKVVLCGAMASYRFIIDTCITAEYDGNIAFDVKLMPRGKTVAEGFGLVATKPKRYQLDRLWLEIPLRKEAVPLFSMYPNSAIHLRDGTDIAPVSSSNSGAVPAQDMGVSFKALLWLGNEEYGLGYFAERDQNWQPADAEKAIEILHTEDAVVLRVHLLDSHPVSWKEPPENGMNAYAPIGFSFGLQPTPVKPFPRNPYPIHGMHLDCFIKTKGNYIDFLNAENRFDRLKEKGVDTLILHEKWNKSQNWFELSEYTQNQIRQIVSECHRRGIRVLTYFGYEIASMAPVWTEKNRLVRMEQENGKHGGGWYRVPFQRDYMVCYRNEWQDRFVEGVASIMDTCGIDGVYLDGTSRPHFCTNELHGCGWRDENGELHGSYPVLAVREMFKKLYAAVHSRGGIINVHASGMQNFTALPFIDLSWYGEYLQFAYVHGDFSDAPLDYFRSEYIGRNMGVPVEFIAYENRPVWNFENAVALAIIHGILPRPNDIDGPLDQMAEIWKIFDRFPIVQSDWMPYWKNGAETSDPRVKISYYRYRAVDGAVSLLAFCANTGKEEARGVTFRLQEDAALTRWDDLTRGEPLSCPLSLRPYEYRIFFVH